jgi:hypothetical protein
VKEMMKAKAISLEDISHQEGMSVSPLSLKKILLFIFYRLCTVL